MPLNYPWANRIRGTRYDFDGKEVELDPASPWLMKDWNGVIIHGVPYFALIYFYAKARRETTGPVYRTLSQNWLIFLATLWALAYAEELFWNRGVWHERNWLFGANWDWTDWKIYIVPLLAVPQLTHYILDGFIWRRKGNANVRIAV